jgi:hypothetical protein
VIPFIESLVAFASKNSHLLDRFGTSSPELLMAIGRCGNEKYCCYIDGAWGLYDKKSLI